ncbi:TonB-dependent receptor [Phenylobacterium sp. J367]|nr:TonB-dependent receptor [Phenylobacterium sp. J367]
MGENNVDRTERDGGRLAFRFQLSDAWQADLSAAGQRLRSNDSQYVSQGMGQNRGNRVQEAHKNDFAVGALNLRGELPWASLTSSLTYVQHTYSSLYDATPVAIAGGTYANLGGDLGVFHETARVSMWVEDFVLRSSRPGPLAWLIGAYATSAIEKTPSMIGVRTPGGLRTAYRENRHDKVRELALYGEASYGFGDGWTAAAGGRLFETRVKTLSDVTTVAPGVSRAFEGERRFSDFSPALSLQKEFAGGELVYLLYSEGFRNGGFNTGGILPIRASRLTFAPDRLRNYEAGAKLRLLDQRLSARGAVFFDKWSNLQSDQYRPSGVAYTANAGDARVLGFEAEAAYDFDFGLQLQANLLLADSDMTRTNPNFSDTALVDALPGVPDVSGGILAVYERPLDGSLTLRLSGEASYVGESTVSFLSVRAYAQEDYVRGPARRGGLLQPVVGDDLRHQSGGFGRRHLRLRQSLHLWRGGAARDAATPPHPRRQARRRLLTSSTGGRSRPAAS